MAVVIQSGLRGKDIPLMARIFAVVDAFDALTTERPYREKISHEEALSYLHEQAGILFDPEVVSAFEKIFIRGAYRHSMNKTMAKKHSRFGFTPQEQRISVLPSAIAGVLALIFIIGNGIGMWRQENTDPVFLLEIGMIGAIYLIIFNFLIIPSLNFEPALGWINAIVSGIGLVLLTYVLPAQSDIYLGVLLITIIITCALISGRGLRTSCCSLPCF